MIYKSLGKNVYIAKEESNRVNILNALLIENVKNNKALLIDANYPFKYIDELYSRIKSPAEALILSHCHIDHSAHAFYHQEKYNTPVLIPEQEKEYLLNLGKLRDDTGFTELGLADIFDMMVRKYMKFKECKEVSSYKPGKDVFNYDNVIIKTIHIPGHSPGHTAFKIDFHENLNNKSILYVSDIGSHPYYGDFFCNLKDYFDSIDKLEKLYLSGDYILIPAHGNIYIEKNKRFFEKIRNKIKNNEQKVLNALKKDKPKTIKELVYEGTLTPKERMNPIVKDLYLVWDGGKIYLHLQDLIERGLVKKVKEKDFLNDRYILL
ncbi:MAG: MBL fold metallo-hydrolase [Promethearchaeota archaeon]